MGSILRLLVVLAIGWFVYSYVIQQDTQNPSARYQDPELSFDDESGSGAGSSDDCARYINPEQLESCLEAKIQKAAEKRSP